MEKVEHKRILTAEFLDKMTTAEQKEMYTAASLLYENKACKKILEAFLQQEIVYTAKEAFNEHEINFGRAGIRFVELFSKELERLHGVYMDSIREKEKFDENEVI